MPLTARLHPGRGPSSWLSTTRTYGTSLTSHHASAAWAANVLQPETTTTRGLAADESSDDPRGERVVVPDQPLGAGQPEPPQVHRSMRGLDAPRAPGDGACGVQDRKIDLG